MTRETRSRSRLSLERLEDRLAMSGVFAGNTLSSAAADVVAPKTVASVQTVISPQNLAGYKPSTVFGLNVSPASGSALDPRIVAVLGADGKPLPLTLGAVYKPGVYGMTNATFLDSVPGPVTIEIAGANGTTGAGTVRTFLPGDINGQGRVTSNAFPQFAAAYTSHYGDAFYNSYADANGNGFVGRGDGNILERNLTPPIPKPRGPLNLYLQLAPQDQARSSQKNSGGITRHTTVTVQGITFPDSLIYFDSGLGDYRFNGPVAFTNAQGRFQAVLPLHTTDYFTNFDFLVRDPFGRQVIRDFPILRLQDSGRGHR